MLPPFFHFRITPATKVAADFNSSGYDGLSTYTDNRFQAFDDLGMEPQRINYYGTNVNTMEHVLAARYDRREKDITYVTTNLSFKDVGDRYGERISDRCLEMFNLVKIEGESWR